MNAEHEGKRYLITGAGSGIGHACARRLAKAGAKLALIGRSPDELALALGAIGGEEQGHLSITADISVEKQMRCAHEILRREWGKLDGVVANAGINGVWAPLPQISFEEWTQAISVNLNGTFLTVKGTLPLMAQSSGSVVIVSSVNGTRIFSNSGATAYACSKAGQVAFTKMLALECAKERIRFNVVCPGAIQTNIEDSTERRNLDGIHLPVEYPGGEVPLTGGLPGTADDVAATICFLLSEASGHVTGTEIYVDGAQSLLQG